MFSKNEIRLFDKRYFNILRITHEENFVEIQSKNTKDYWVIKKNVYYDDWEIYIYHKHPRSKYYHRHWQCHSIKQSIKSIYSHDQYRLNKRLYV